MIRMLEKKEEVSLRRKEEKRGACSRWIGAREGYLEDFWR